jgi:hypothetical protein
MLCCILLRSRANNKNGYCLILTYVAAEDCNRTPSTGEWLQRRARLKKSTARAGYVYLPPIIYVSVQQGKDATQFEKVEIVGKRGSSDEDNMNALTCSLLWCK